MPTRADYAKINIACKELGIDKSSLIQDRYGKSSTKLLTGPETIDLLAHLRGLGFKPRKGRAKSSNYIEIKPGPAARQQKKVLAMWNALGYDVAKLHSRCKNQFGIARFEWVTKHNDLHVLITDLQARMDRAGIR